MSKKSHNLSKNDIKIVETNPLPATKDFEDILMEDDLTVEPPSKSEQNHDPEIFIHREFNMSDHYAQYVQAVRNSLIHKQMQSIYKPETPGGRLRYQIECHGYKYGEFAEQSGITSATLSRFMNDKQVMSEKYMRRAALMLDVSYDYLAGLTEDPAPLHDLSHKELNPSLYLDKNNELSEEEFIHQQIQIFTSMQNVLKELGVTYVWQATMGTTSYYLGKDDMWHPTFELMEELRTTILWTKEDFLQALYHCSDEKHVWIEMTYKGHKKKMDYDLFQVWIKGFLASIELRLQDTFEFHADLSMKVYETDISEALHFHDKSK